MSLASSTPFSKITRKPPMNCSRWFMRNCAGLPLPKWRVSHPDKLFKPPRSSTRRGCDWGAWFFTVLPTADTRSFRSARGEERRTRVQNLVTPLRFSDESIDVSPGFVEQIGKALRNMGDRHNVLVKFIGYTDDLPLSERNERIYGTNVGLSRARARCVALAVQQALHLRP